VSQAVRWQAKQQLRADVPLPDEVSEEVQVSDDDMDFVSSAGKSMAFLATLDTKQLDQ
jgi:hypothetical protein